MLTEVCAFVLAVNEVIECVTGAGAQNSGDSDRCDWVVVEPGRSVTIGRQYNSLYACVLG